MRDMIKEGKMPHPAHSLNMSENRRTGVGRGITLCTVTEVREADVTDGRKESARRTV